MTITFFFSFILGSPYIGDPFFYGEFNAHFLSIHYAWRIYTVKYNDKFIPQEIFEF